MVFEVNCYPSDSMIQWFEFPQNYLVMSTEVTSPAMFCTYWNATLA